MWLNDQVLQSSGADCAGWRMSNDGPNWMIEYDDQVLQIKLKACDGPTCIRNFLTSICILSSPQMHTKNCMVTNFSHLFECDIPACRQAERILKLDPQVFYRKYYVFEFFESHSFIVVIFLKHRLLRHLSSTIGVFLVVIPDSGTVFRPILPTESLHCTRP